MGKRLLLIAASSLACFSLRAQNTPLRVVSGTLLSPEGDPLPGVSVRIKNTATGTVTNMEGWYSLEARLGDVLVYSFVGFTPYEVTVSEQNSTTKGGARPPQHQRDPQPARGSKNLDALTDGAGERGVAVLSDSSVSFDVLGQRWQHRNRIHGPLASIRYNRKKGSYLLVPTSYQQQHAPTFRLEASTAWSRSTVYRLPALQQRYAQGRAQGGDLRYRGPEEGEPFSWGPALSSLGYDADGRLVPGQDALRPAAAFDATGLFQPAHAIDNRFQLFSELREWELRLGYANKLKTGILPTASFGRHGLDFSLKKRFYGFEPRLYFSYSGARENLPLRGSNLSGLLGSLYTTPPSVDLAAGHTGSRPWNSPATYLAADGSQRSYAPGSADHPYWLLNTLPDHRQTTKLLSGLDLQLQELLPFRLQYTLSLDREQTEEVWGLAPGTVGALSGRLSERSFATTTLSSTLIPTLDVNLYHEKWALDLYTAYLFHYQQAELYRRDGYSFEGLHQYSLSAAEEVLREQIEPFRRTHEVVTKGTLYWSGPRSWSRFMQLGLANRLYISSTLPEGQQAYFLPSANLSADLGKLLLFQNSRYFNNLAVYASFASTLQEAPLLYNQWHFNSLQYRPEEYRQYQETAELPFGPGLLPEKQQKLELGTRLQLLKNYLNLTLNHYLNITDQLLVPVWTGSSYQLQNLAKLYTPGQEVSLSSQGRFSNGSWETGLSLSRPRPYVKELYTTAERVPLAGFSSISTNLVEGQPYGVLWGSRFMRNPEGQLLIGPDGFPLADSREGLIGNPNPAWLAGLSASSSWNRVSLSFSFEAKKGGHIWNGTQQFLNYYGSSQQSAEQRLIRGYVFEGVTESGSPNQQPVDFYNPALPMEENRWLRYGQAGIAEEAIEEASWLRLQEVQLSYDLTFALRRLAAVHRAKLSFVGKNLWVSSSYSGIDPVSNLFGYQHASGLDLFNQPNVKSYGFALTIHL